MIIGVFFVHKRKGRSKGNAPTPHAPHPEPDHGESTVTDGIPGGAIQTINPVYVRNRPTDGKYERVGDPIDIPPHLWNRVSDLKAAVREEWGDDVILIVPSGENTTGHGAVMLVANPKRKRDAVREYLSECLGIEVKDGYPGGDPIDIPRDRWEQVRNLVATIRDDWGVEIFVPPPGNAVSFTAAPGPRREIRKQLSEALGIAVKDGMPNTGPSASSLPPTSTTTQSRSRPGSAYENDEVLPPTSTTTQSRTRPGSAYENDEVLLPTSTTTQSRSRPGSAYENDEIQNTNRYVGTGTANARPQSSTSVMSAHYQHDAEPAYQVALHHVQSEVSPGRSRSASSFA